MNRTEAYALLVEEMTGLSQKGAEQLDALLSTTTNIDRPGDGGSLYSLALVVERVAPGRFVIIGRIHDNDSHRFSLLEERLEFEAGKSE